MKQAISVYGVTVSHWLHCSCSSKSRSGLLFHNQLYQHFMLMHYYIFLLFYFNKWAVQLASPCHLHPPDHSLPLYLSLNLHPPLHPSQSILPFPLLLHLFLHLLLWPSPALTSDSLQFTAFSFFTSLPTVHYSEFEYK